MSYESLFGELVSLQNEIIQIVETLPEKDYIRQFHPDLSPIGWHLGHCIYTESFWVREQLLNKKCLDENLRSLYVPELSNKQSRGDALPSKERLIKTAKTEQSENNLVLRNEIEKNNPHHLLEDHFLLKFLIQHYSQHLETIQMALVERQIQNKYNDYLPSKRLTPLEITQQTINIKKGEYEIGSEERHQSYDNERPLMTVKLDEFNISRCPINNAKYLSFIESNGYSDRSLWSDKGWHWREKYNITQPHNWQLNQKQHWYGIDVDGAFSLEPEEPVMGLSYFETQAFANFAKARLPHEYEWEVASKLDVLKHSGIVWEWCNNTFHSYPGFQAYPYEGYSVPYFDDDHYVLRGGSRYTRKNIKRPTFRNYYSADKRHIFAGLRLVFD